jgi:hypothetical protein
MKRVLALMLCLALPANADAPQTHYLITIEQIQAINKHLDAARQLIERQQSEIERLRGKGCSA